MERKFNTKPKEIKDMEDEIEKVTIPDTINLKEMLKAYQKIMKEFFDTPTDLMNEFKYRFFFMGQMYGKTLEEQLGYYLALGVVKEEEDITRAKIEMMLEAEPQGLPS